MEFYRRATIDLRGSQFVAHDTVPDVMQPPRCETRFARHHPTTWMMPFISSRVPASSVPDKHIKRRLRLSTNTGHTRYRATAAPPRTLGSFSSYENQLRSARPIFANAAASVLISVFTNGLSWLSLTAYLDAQLDIPPQRWVCTSSNEPCVSEP
jgi:hypothetical protein